MVYSDYNSYNSSLLIFMSRPSSHINKSSYVSSLSKFETFSYYSFISYAAND